jgi:hypothetical protein
VLFLKLELLYIGVNVILHKVGIPYEIDHLKFAPQFEESLKILFEAKNAI